MAALRSGKAIARRGSQLSIGEMHEQLEFQDRRWTCAPAGAGTQASDFHSRVASRRQPIGCQVEALSDGHAGVAPLVRDKRKPGSNRWSG